MVVYGGLMVLSYGCVDLSYCSIKGRRSSFDSMLT